MRVKSEHEYSKIKFVRNWIPIPMKNDDFSYFVVIHEIFAVRT